MSSGVFDEEGLREAVRRGAKPTYVFFWGHQGGADGAIGGECLSQWWPAPFTLHGRVYPTAEHFMMAEKARLFGDGEIEERILSAPSPDVAKELGRRVRGYDDARWEAARFDVVVKGNLAKFEQQAAARAFLLGTGDAVLVEASPFDRIWGIGLSSDHVDAVKPDKWRGRNLLGFALMKVRAVLAGALPLLVFCLLGLSGAACSAGGRHLEELPRPAFIWGQERDLCGKLAALDGAGIFWSEPGGCEDGRPVLTSHGAADPVKAQTLRDDFDRLLPLTGIPSGDACSGNLDTFTKSTDTGDVTAGACTKLAKDAPDNLPEPYRTLAIDFLALP